MAKKEEKGEEQWDMLVRIRKVIEMEETVSKKDVEGLVVIKLKLGKERWKVVRVYVNGDLERKLKSMRGWMGFSDNYR